MEYLPTLIIGYGNMGTKHARALRELAGPRAVWGIVDPDAGRRERAALDNPGCRAFAQLDEALHGPELPGCAVVAASTPLHFELTRLLLSRRIPTLVEKPIASRSVQAEELIRQASEHGTLLTVGHVERFNPAAVAGRRVIHDRLIGNTIQLCFRRVGGTPAEVPLLEDVLVDLAVHDYDLAQFMTGETLEIIEALGHREGGHLDGALVLGRMAGGASLQLQVNWRTPVKVRRIELTGTTGYAEINLITQQVTLYRQNPLLSGGPVTPESHSYFDDYLRSFAVPDRVELGIDRREPLSQELVAFWRAVVRGEPPPVPPGCALDAVRLTEVTRARLELHNGPDSQRR